MMDGGICTDLLLCVNFLVMANGGWKEDNGAVPAGGMTSLTYPMHFCDDFILMCGPLFPDFGVPGDLLGSVSLVVSDVQVVLSRRRWCSRSIVKRLRYGDDEPREWSNLTGTVQTD